MEKNNTSAPAPEEMPVSVVPEENLKTDAPTHFVAAAPQRLNLRTAPDKSSTILCVLDYGACLIKNGEPIDVDGVIWVPVKASNGIAGYAMEQYLTYMQ